MDLDQSRSFLREMQASWRQELTDDQLLVWAETLADLDFEMARVALRGLRKTSDFMPSHHQLIDATNREWHRHRERANYAGLPSGDRTTDPADAPAHIANLRAVLRAGL